MPEKNTAKLETVKLLFFFKCQLPDGQRCLLSRRCAQPGTALSVPQE